MKTLGKRINFTKSVGKDLWETDMIRPFTDEEAKRAIERAKANRFDEAGNYGENNGPLPKRTKQEKLDAAGDAYQEARVTAWAAYKKVEVTAKATYEEAVAPSRATYEEVIAGAWSAYREVIATTWDTYEEARAKIEEEHKGD